MSEHSRQDLKKVNLRGFEWQQTAIVQAAIVLPTDQSHFEGASIDQT